MDPIPSLLADGALGLAFIAFVCILYRIGKYHAPRGSTGRSVRYDDAAATNAARERGEAMQGREDVSLAEKPERAQRIGATSYHH